MGLLRKLFGEKPGPGPEQSVVLHLRMTDAAGQAAQYETIARALLDAADGFGRVAAEELRGEHYVISLVCVDAQELWERLMPVLEPHPIPRGSFAIIRHGGPGAHEERADLAWEG